MTMKIAVAVAVVSVLLFASSLYTFVQGDNVKRGVAEIFGALLVGVVASVLMLQ